MSSAFAVMGFGRARPEEAGLDPEILEQHRRRIHEHRERGMFPGMVECIIANGKVVYSDLCGFAHKEQQLPMTERSLFRGYSMMKPIVAVAFFTLVEEGRVRIDDPVSLYLPKFADLKVRKKSGEGVQGLRRPMTVRHLLMHTSGLGYGPGVQDRGQRVVARSVAEKTYKDITLRQDSGEVDSLEKLCDALAGKPLLFQPGTAYEYGLSFDVLGRIMEVVTGRALRVIVQERVLDRVGMPDATWEVPLARARQICGYYRILKAKDSAKRYLQRMDGKRPELSAYVKGSAAQYPGESGVPCGGGFWGSCRTGLLFSARDIAAFCHMLLNDGVSISGKRVLKASTIRSLRTNWFANKKAVKKLFPEGWESEDVGWNPLGHVQLTGPHAGALYMGGMSYYWLDPKLQFASVVMTETYWQAQPVGWRDNLDTMELVLERAVEVATKKRQASGEMQERASSSKSRKLA